MKHLKKRHVLATAISALLTGGSALAQVETVIVTAEFRETDVQDTPIAITAISGDMLEDRGQSNVFEIAAQAPNVSLKPGGTGRSGMMASIRGIGQVDFIAALEPGVGVYVDDVYYPQLTGSLLDLLDLDRVEILRGPQGTLAGRNSIGGAIRLYSRAPGTEEGGSVRVSYGSFDQIDVRGVADIELSPGKLYARIAGASRERDGYVDVLDYACSHPGSGAYTNATGRRDCKIDEWGSVNYVTARGSLRWIPSDRVEVNFNLDFLNDDSGSAAATLTYADRTAIEANAANPAISIDDGDPGTAPVYFRDHIFVPYGPYRNPGDPINDPYVNYATLTDPNTGAITAGGDPPVRVPVPWKPLSLPSRNTLDHRGMSMNINWDISDMLSLTSISAYREYDTWMTWDSDLSPIPVTMLDNTLTHNQRSQEIRLNGTTNSVDYTVGAFLFDQYTDYTARVTLPYALLDFVHGPDPTPAETWAVFANSTWHLSDRLNLSAGVRYSDELKDYTHRRHNPDYSPVTADVAGPGDPLFFVNIRVSGLDGATARFEDTRTDWRLAVDYGLNDDMMVYASASTGYKSGGVNPRPFFLPQLNVFEPETLLSYEFGFKSTLADDRLRLNAALFFTEYEDIQLTLNECEVPTFIDPDGISAPCAQPANVGSADINGIELEAEWYMTDYLSLDATFSTIDFEYTQLSPIALVRDTPIAKTDMITPYTPETKWALGLQYGKDMGANGSINFRVDASFQDEVYTNATNHPLNRIDDYTLTNARVWWAAAEEDWEIGLDLYNATDEVYYHTLFDQSTSVGQVSAGPALPRTFSVFAQKSF